MRWLRLLPSDDQPTFRLGRCDEVLVAEWIGIATLRARLGSETAELVAEPGVEKGQVERHLRRSVDALLGHLRGEISLHASSVKRNGMAVAFLGDSGSGKSTLAAQLCAQPGVALLSDDTVGLVFEGPHVAVSPSEDTHALRSDVAKAMGLAPTTAEKTLLPATRAGSSPGRLAAVVALVFEDSAKAPHLRPTHGLRSFSALNRALVRFAIDDAALQRAELDKFARIVEQAAFYELVRSHDLANLAATADVAGVLLRSLSERADT